MRAVTMLVMASIGELVSGLRGALRKIAEGTRRLGQAETTWTEAGDGYSAVLAGSGQPEHQALADLHGQATRHCGEATALLGQCAAKIEEVIRRYAGEPVGAGPAGEAAAKPYQNPHGDNYPPEAAAMAGALPKRVVPNNGERTVSVARVNERIIPGVSSGGLGRHAP